MVVYGEAARCEGPVHFRATGSVRQFPIPLRSYNIDDIASFRFLLPGISAREETKS